MIRATVCLLLALPIVVWWRRRTQESVPLHFPDESWEEVQRDPRPDNPLPCFGQQIAAKGGQLSASDKAALRNGGGLPRGDTALKHRSVR